MNTSTAGGTDMPVEAALPSFSNTRAVARNTLYQVAAKIWVTLISLVSITLTTRYLGTDGYGVLSTATAYFYFFGILADWGLYTFAVREVAKDPGSANRVVTSVIYFRLLLALAVAAAGAVVAFALPYSAQIKAAIFVLLIGVPLNSLMQSFFVIFQARLEMKYAALSDGLSRLGGLVALGLVIWLDLGLLAVVTTHVFSILLAVALSFWWMRRFIGLGRPDLAYARRLFLRAVPFGVASVVITFYFKIDMVLLSLLHDVDEVGIYGVAYRILELVLTVPGFFALSVFPVISRYVAEGHLRLTAFVQRSLDVLILVGLPIAVIVILLADPLISLIAGGGFAASADALRVLMLAVAFYFVNVLLGYLLLAQDRQAELLRIGLFAFTINVASNLIFIPRFGYMGAAWTTVGSEVVVTAVTFSLVQRAYRLRWSANALAKGVVAVGGAAAPTVALVLPTELAPAARIVLGGAVFATVYISLVYVLRGIDREQLRELLPFAGVVLRRARP